MSFALNDTHIDGGTFNNVAGNMTQVFNSHVSHARISAGGEREGIRSFRPSTSSIGAIRAERGLRHRNGEPYAITNRRHRHEHHQSELPHSNGNSSSGYVHGSQAIIAPRQMLVAGGFQHMVKAIHGTGKLRPLVVTMVTAWLDENGQLQLDWVEAVPEGIRVRQSFEKQYAKLSSDYINAMYAWAEKPLQDYVAVRDASARHAPPVFPVTAEALDDMSPNMVAQTVTSFLVKSYHAVFGSEDIPWAAIASAPDEYYDSVNFDLAFSSKGLEELKSTQWHALAMTLASGAGEGSSGLFRKACSVAGEEQEQACGTEEEARLKREQEEEEEARLKHEEEEERSKREEEARLKREEEERLKHEEEEARLKREEEEARLKHGEEEARLKREEEERSKQEQGQVPGGRKRRAEDQLIPEDAGAVRRTGRARLSPEEAKLEREKKLAATVGAGKVKPSYKYVEKNPAKPKPKTRRT